MLITWVVLDIFTSGKKCRVQNTMYYKFTDNLKGLLYYKPAKSVVPYLLPFDNNNVILTYLTTKLFSTVNKITRF